MTSGFSELLLGLARGRGLPLPRAHDPEPLALLDYADEVALKQAALAAFWQAQRLPAQPLPVVATPLPRGYRSTSKRRAEIRRGGLELAFPGASAPPGGVAPSLLDRPEHVALYAHLLPALARRAALATALNHVIVRGSGSALALILSVRVLDAKVVRAAKQIAEALQAGSLGVRSACLYLDPSGSDYYLEARRPRGVLSGKQLFGPDWLEVGVGALRLRFPTTAFSQVSEAMLPALVDTAGGLLSPIAGHALVDLYCGYGLFSLALGKPALSVVGIDHAGPAIEAARANAQHLGRPARFVAGSIDGEFLRARLAPARAPEVVLLDPPRQGTAAGVIEALAERRPQRVVHVCCGVDEVPRELAAWQRAGRTLRRVVPLDLFAGTANLELLLLL